MQSAKKRFLSLFLALVLALSLCPAAFAAGLDNFQAQTSFRDGQFTDLPSTHWAYGNIRSACEYGLMKGSSNSTFSPDGEITIAETLALASRLHSIYHTGSENFQQGSPWYQCYVDYALENGLLTEEYDNYNNAIPRWGFVQILGQAFPAEALEAINTVDDGAIPDVPMSEFYAEDVYRLYRAGILTGNDESGVFAPTSFIRRSESAALVSRMVEPDLRANVTLRTPGKITEAEAKEMDSLVDEISSLEDRLESQGKSEKEMTAAVLQAVEDKPFIAEAYSGEDGNVTVRTDFGVTAIWQHYDEPDAYLGGSTTSTWSTPEEATAAADTILAKAADMKDGVDIVLLAPYAGEDEHFILDGYEWLLNKIVDGVTGGGSLTILRDQQVSLNALKNLDQYDMVFFYSHGTYSCVANSAWAVLPSDPYTMTGEFASPTAYVLLSNDFFFGRTVVDLSTGRIGVGGNFYNHYYDANDLDGMFFHFASCYSMRTDKLANGLLSRGAAWVEGYNEPVLFTNDFYQANGVVNYLLEGNTAQNAVTLMQADPEWQTYAQEDCVMRTAGGEFRLPVGPSDEELVRAVLDAEAEWGDDIWTSYGLEIYFMDLTLDGVPEFVMGQMNQGSGFFSSVMVYQYQNGKMVHILPEWEEECWDTLTLCRSKSDGSLFYLGYDFVRSGFAWNGSYWTKYEPEDASMRSTLLYYKEHLTDNNYQESDNYYDGNQNPISEAAFEARKSAFEASFEDLGTPRGKVLESWKSSNSYTAKYNLLLPLLKDIPAI